MVNSISFSKFQHERFTSYQGISTYGFFFPDNFESSGVLIVQSI